jgi:large subunit ribosomal protein L15
MKHIGNLQYAEGAKHKNKRIGRGPGSGHGGTATKGNKGAQARSGFHQFRGFEGGQMPLNRRLPKFGFTNRFRVEYQVINLDRIQELFDEGRFEDNNITIDALFSMGALSNGYLPLKVLGNGELKTALNVEAHHISASAKQKIESVGGTVTIHG